MVLELEIKKNNQYLNTSTEKQIEFEILKKLQIDLQNLVFDDQNNNNSNNNDSISPDDILIMNNCNFSIHLTNHKNGIDKNIYTDVNNNNNNIKKNSKISYI